MTGPLIKIGRIGKAHGLRGELKVRIEDAYLEAALASDSLFVEASGHKIPHFIEYLRSDGALIKIEEVDDKSAASVLQQKDIYLPADRIKDAVLEEEEVPYLSWIGYQIIDQELGSLGKINDVYDLPQHYLAEITYQKKSVMIPLHADLILATDDSKKVVNMQLPEGLLDL